MRRATREFYGSPAVSPAVARRSSLRVWFVLALAGIAVVSLGYVRLTDGLAATGYDVANLQAEERQWTMKNDQLKLDIAQQQSLDRIDQIASGRLGMGPPSRVVYVTAPLGSLPPLPAPDPTPVSVAAPIDRLIQYFSIRP